MYKADYSKWLEKGRKNIVLVIKYDVKSSGRISRGFKGVISVLKYVSFTKGTNWFEKRIFNTTSKINLKLNI